MRELVWAFESEYAGLSLKKNLIFGVFFVVASALMLAWPHYQWKPWPNFVPPTVLEAWATITGALCVWLTIGRHVINFPIGMISSVLMAIVLYRQAIYGEFALQFFFLVLAIQGWYWWLHGGKNRTELPLSRANKADGWILLATALIGFPAVVILLNLLNGSAPIADSFTTVFSVMAQIMMNRKKVEAWWIWIIVDIIYVPLHYSRHLPLLAILYFVFLIMATIGLIEWIKAYREQQAEMAVA